MTFVLAPTALLLGVIAASPRARAFQETPAAEPAPAQATNGESPPSTGAAPVDGARLLTEARDRLFAYPSVRARFTESATLGGRRFQAEGTYLAGAFPRLRLEYRVQIGSMAGDLLQVCDGQILRTRREIGPTVPEGQTPSKESAPTVSVSRRDVQQILQAARETPNQPETVLAAELGLGGLPALLAAMEQTMEFEAVRHKEIGGRGYHILLGKWRPQSLAALQSQLGRNAEAASSMIPDHVRIYLDEETLFPSRIVYLQKSETSEEAGSYRGVFTMEFTEIVLNEPVDPEAFRYIPPAGVNEVDETKEFVRAIQEARTPAAPAANDQ